MLLNHINLNGYFFSFNKDGYSRHYFCLNLGGQIAAAPTMRVCVNNPVI